MEEYIPYELKGKELLEVINLGSKFSKEESIELKFYVKTTGNLVKVAQDIARDETTGPWVGQENLPNYLSDLRQMLIG